MRVTILDFTYQSWNWKACASGSLNHIFKRRKNEEVRREQDGEGVGGLGVHLSPRIPQEYTFRHRSACRTLAESGQEYLTRGKEHRTSQNSVMKELGGKTGVLVGLDLPSVDGGAEAGIQSPHRGNCLSQRRNI